MDISRLKVLKQTRRDSNNFILPWTTLVNTCLACNIVFINWYASKGDVGTNVEKLRQETMMKFHPSVSYVSDQRTAAAKVSLITLGKMN